MCGADVAETRRRASCGNGGPCVTWHEYEQTKAAANKQMQSESARHNARMRMQESACMSHVHACMPSAQATDTHWLRDRVCLCRESRDVRRRCGRDTTTRIMRKGPARVSHVAARTHDINRQSGERTNQWNQNQSDTKRRTRMRESSACIAYNVCAHACMPSHRHSPPARSCVCVESVMCGADVCWPRHDDAHHAERPVCHMRGKNT